MSRNVKTYDHKPYDLAELVGAKNDLGLCTWPGCATPIKIKGHDPYTLFCDRCEQYFCILHCIIRSVDYRSLCPDCYDLEIDDMVAGIKSRM